MGRVYFVLRTDEITRTRLDQLKTLLRNFINNNSDVQLVEYRYQETDPP